MDKEGKSSVVLVISIVCAVTIFPIAISNRESALQEHSEPADPGFEVTIRGTVTAMDRQSIASMFGNVMAYEYSIIVNSTTSIVYRRYVVPTVIDPWIIGDEICHVKMAGFTMPSLIEPAHDPGTIEKDRYDGIILASQIPLVNDTFIERKQARDDWIASRSMHEAALAAADAWFAFGLVVFIVSFTLTIILYTKLRG